RKFHRRVRLKPPNHEIVREETQTFFEKVSATGHAGARGSHGCPYLVECEGKQSGRTRYFIARIARQNESEDHAPGDISGETPLDLPEGPYRRRSGRAGGTLARRKGAHDTNSYQRN